MRTVELRSGTTRYVLFLENPANVYRNSLEGSIRQRVDTQVEQFLTEASPESALQNVRKFLPPLRQLKDRGGKARALGTWCQGDGFDLFVVQILYDKDDEASFLPKKHVFAERGVELEEQFGSMSHGEIREKVREWRSRDSLMLFSDA